MIFDVIVIGAGHAGIEAATAASRIGAKVALITISEDNIGELSCNPSIGGIGKGTVVREIDALNGLMSKITDLSSINRKILNRSKGKAVWGLRHQVDRELYKINTKNLLFETNITIIYDIVNEIIVVDGKISAIELENKGKILCHSLVCTTGTFLHGKIIIGEERYSAGRINEIASTELSDSLQNLGLDMTRLKTGTPCRIDMRTINFHGLDRQLSEEDAPFMSCETKMTNVKQVPCYITHTNENSAEIIRNNKHLIPTVNGSIKFKGPRYCPSIEDKIFRFSHRINHQIFLEPEGIDSISIYPNGISTSMGKDLQIEFIRTIKGLEKAELLKFGYAIEYDIIQPYEVLKTLETKKIKNLFLAGQILGTTGYEEAGGLGIIAGINAALKADNENKEFVLSRSDGYIGVMIDDLTTTGIDGEPYRLFTSRSEYRLSSRYNNADIRLTDLGYKTGVITEQRYRYFQKKKKIIEEIVNLLNNKIFTPYELDSFDIKINQDGIKRNCMELLHFDQINIKTLLQILNYKYDYIDNEILDYIETEAKYSPYIKRHKSESEQLEKLNTFKIPENFDFKNIKSLSNEVIEKLNKFKPKSMGDLKSIPGITPAATIAIMIALRG